MLERRLAGRFTKALEGRALRFASEEADKVLLWSCDELSHRWGWRRGLAGGQEETPVIVTVEPSFADHQYIERLETCSRFA